MRWQLMLFTQIALQIWHSTPAVAKPSQPTPEPKTAQKIIHTDKRNNLIEPVGRRIAGDFVPLTEIPPPSKNIHTHDGRRHLEEDCTTEFPSRLVVQEGNVEIVGDYYEERQEKTLVTILFPDHIDRHHFEVTTQVPYLTVGHEINAIGYHPSTQKSKHPSECEKIYQDQVAAEYLYDSDDASEESLELARMPVFPQNVPAVHPFLSEQETAMYADK